MGSVLVYSFLSSRYGNPTRFSKELERGLLYHLQWMRLNNEESEGKGISDGCIWKTVTLD